MSTILGIFAKNGDLVQASAMNSIMDELSYWEPDKSGIWIEDNIGLGNHHLNTTKESLEEDQPYFDQSNGCCITSDSRIDYREELANHLPYSIEEISTMTDSQIILNSYNILGKSCVKYLYGDYAFAIWDSRSKELFCARDHFGCRPFYYFNSPEYFIFSSEVKGILNSPYVKTQIKDSWIADSMMSIDPEKYDSAFANIRRLCPSFSLTVSNEKLILDKYWELSKIKIKNDLEEIQAAEMLKDHFVKSIGQRIRTQYSIGTELSGGLDSSSIASVANSIIREEKNMQLIAFSHVLPDNIEKDDFKIIDESPFSNLLISFVGIKKHSKISGKNCGALSSINKSLRLNGYPSSESYGMMSDQLFKNAKEKGVRILLSGYGGDEGVTMQAKVYLKELAKKWRIRSLISEIRKKSDQGTLIVFKELVFIFFASHCTTVIRKFRKFLIKDGSRIRRHESFGIDRNFEIQQNANKRFLNRDETWKEILVSERQKERMNSKAFPNRLEESYLFAKSNRIMIFYPFLDVKLVEFYYSLPSIYKYKNGIGRYLFRKAMVKLLPEKILWREDKTRVAIPNVPYRFKLDLVEFKQIVIDGRENNKYHLVDYDKMFWMIDQMLLLASGNEIDFLPKTFFSHIKVLILQKWQREGKIDIGIKC